MREGVETPAQYPALRGSTTQLRMCFMLYTVTLGQDLGIENDVLPAGGAV